MRDALGIWGPAKTFCDPIIVTWRSGHRLESRRVRTSHAIVNDPRQWSLSFGRPLVFVCVYKLLDMWVEWVLETNGKKVPNQFAQKKSAIQEPGVQIPPAIFCRPELQSALLGLYMHLDAARSAIIHRATFDNRGPDLLIEYEQKSGEMLKFAISDRTLLQFAELIACAVMLSQGHDVDEVGERRIEFLIDQWPR